MSYSPAQLANRRWSVGGSFTEQLQGPAQPSVLNGGMVSRANVATNLVVPIHPNTKIGDLMILMAAGGGATPTTPSGWLSLNGGNNAGYGYGGYSKTATAADLAAGSVVLSVPVASPFKAAILTVPGVGWKATGSGDSSGTGVVAGTWSAAPSSGLSIQMFWVGNVQASITPSIIGSGIWSYATDLSQYSSVVLWGAATSSGSTNVNFTFPTNSVYNVHAINVVNTGFSPWSAALPATWVEIAAAAPYDTFLMDMGLDYPQSAPQGGGDKYLLEFAVGPAGAESSLYTAQIQMPGLLTSGPASPSLALASVPMAVKAGQRLAVRGIGRNVAGTILSPTYLPNAHLSFAGV